MNFIIKLFILCAVDIYIFLYVGRTWGFIGLGIILFRILHTLGILRSPKLFRGALGEGILYLKDYQGPYNNPEPYKEALYLISTYKLEKFFPIGIFYDKPGEVPDDKLRCSIGIYRKIDGFPGPLPKEFESYCQMNNYYSAEYPLATCLYSSWDYSNLFTLMIGIKKFNDVLKKNLADAMFKATYRIQKIPKIVVELYSSESKLEFYVPIVYEDKFFFYKKEEKPKSE